MIRPPFRARDVPPLRADLLERGPFMPGTDVPIKEASQLLSVEQRLRPAGYRYQGDDIEPTAALELEAWHRQCILSSHLYWIEPELIRYAWAVEPQTKPLPLRELFTTMPKYGFCVFGEPIDVPLEGGESTTPITAVSWAPMAEIPWPVEVFSAPEDSRTGRASRGVFPDMETQQAWWHLRFFTTPKRNALTDLMAEHGMREKSLAEEFDIPLNCSPHIDVVPHCTPGTTEGFGDSYNMPRALQIAFFLARSPRVGQIETEPIIRPERRRAAKRGEPFPGGNDAEIRTMSMRPHVRQAFTDAERGAPARTGSSDRRAARYEIPFWPVAPSIDPVTNEIKKQGYWASRNPALLAESPSGTVVHTASLPKRP